MEYINIIISVLSLLATAYIGFIGFRLTKTFSIKSEKLNHQSLFHQLFREFNSRYSVVNSYLIKLEKLSNTEEYSLNDLKSNFDLYDKINDYLNICAEEYYWYKEGRLDEDVWHAWHIGMKEWYNKLPILQQLWQDEIKGDGYKSYYLKNRENFFEN